MVESERGHHIVWVISVLEIVNFSSSNKHCSVIANPLESPQPTAKLMKQRLNCAYLLALWHDVVSPSFVLVCYMTAIKFTPSSIERDELVTIIIRLTNTVQWI